MNPQKGSTSGKSRDRIISAYERFALEQVRGSYQRALADFQREQGGPDYQAEWRAEGRLASWQRVLDAAEREFGVK